MQQYAIYKRGDETQLVEYETRKGVHRFRTEDELHAVEQNPNVEPVTVHDLGDLIRVGELPWYLRWAKKRLNDQIYDMSVRGVSLRFFEELQEGDIELPVTNILGGWRRFSDDVSRHCVAWDEQTGKPDLDARGAQRIAAMMQQSGVPRDDGLSYIRYHVGVQKMGHFTGFIHEHILRFLLPAAESALMIVMWMGLGALIGIDVASNTVVGDLYATNNNSSYLLLLLPVGFAFLFWRRSR